MQFANSFVPAISFVVPVYNTEKYLRECLDSIVCQLDGNELILINDGSTDSSRSICDEYVEKFPEIKICHTDNCGVSHARNLGVSLAQGMYIVFVDSDDFINRDFADEFNRANFAADVVFFSMRKLLKNGKELFMNDGISADVLRYNSADDVLEHISNCPKFPASPCGKLVNREFLIKNNIHFAFNRISEDYDWTYQLLQHCRSFDYFDGGIYTYRQIPQSRSSIGQVKSVGDQLVILTSWERKDITEDFKRPLRSFLAYEYAMILPFYGSLSRKEKYLYSREIRRCAYLLRYGKSIKLKLIRIASLLFGIELTAKVLNEYISRRNRRYGK